MWPDIFISVSLIILGVAGWLRYMESVKLDDEWEDW
jgi:hypothetical protein